MNNYNDNYESVNIYEIFFSQYTIHEMYGNVFYIVLYTLSYFENFEIIYINNYFCVW